MALGPNDLVLCTTTMGPRPLREFLAAAGAAGFTGVSLSGGDYKTARASGLSDADIRAMLANNGLSVADLDSAVDWFRPLPRQSETEFDLSQPFFGHSISEFLDMAGAVGAAEGPEGSDGLKSEKSGVLVPAGPARTEAGRHSLGRQALPASAFSAAEKFTARPGTMVEMACLYTIWVTVLRSRTTY